MKFYSLWSEWDMGQEGLIFSSIEAAKVWTDRGNKLNGVYEEGDTLDDIWDDLQGVHLLEIVSLSDLV